MIAPIAPANTTEWHQLRRTGIGASEAAAACGLSRWETPLDVWARKVGQAEGKVETPVMALGTLMEGAIWTQFQRMTGTVVSRVSPGLFRHASLKHVLASPDAELADSRLGESKVTSDANGELGEGNDELPVEWICQAFQQMAVTGAPAVVFAVVVVPQEIRSWLLDVLRPEHAAAVLSTGLAKGKVELRHFTVDSHTSGIRNLLNRVDAFWTNHVVPGVMPSVDWSHARTVEAVKRACLQTKVGEVVDLGEDAVKLAGDLASTKDQIKKLGLEEKRLSAELMLKVGTASGGRLPDGQFLKKIVVAESEIPAYTRASYCYLKPSKEK